MKFSSSMPFFCLVFFFLVRGSAQICSGDYVNVLDEWPCISKKQCLERGFVISNGYCRRTCPGAFYLSYDDRTCHRSCPHDTVVNGSNCLNSTQCTAEDMFVYNGSCADSCPLGTMVTMSDVCVHNCPYQTITNTTHCINPHNCTEAGRVIFNNTCTDQCPPGFPYVDSGRCASDCRDDKVSFNHQCITQHRCIHEEGKVIQNRSCVGSCSPDTPIIYEGQCHSECPSGTVLSASLSTCLVDSVCTEKGQFILNRTCVAECPRYVSGKACVDECPRETVLYHKECITTSKCTHFNYLYMYLFNGTCVESCPEEAPNTDASSCYAVCPRGKVAENRLCVYPYQCNSKVIHNNTCLTSCPETAPLLWYRYGKTYCVSVCPDNTVFNDKQCISNRSCTSKQKVIFNGTCIGKCPRGNQYIEDGKCQSECSRHSVKLCFKYCPDITSVQNITCISSDLCISRGNFVFNGICLTTCPEESPYSRDGVCHRRCPPSTVKQNITCISSDRCISQGNFVFNGACLTTCPEESPYISGGICHRRCPPSTVKQNITCISSDRCISQGNFVFNGACLTTCPEESPYISGGICHRRCPPSTVKQNITCISSDRCISQGNFVFNGACLTTCPEEAPYHRGGICHHQCPQGQRAAGTECIECDSDKFLDGKECIYKYECHKRKKFSYKGKCLSSCPHGTKEAVEAYTNTCLAQPNLPLLLTLLFAALLISTVICLCMTIPRNGARTRDDRIKAILTTKTRKEVYENHGFEELEVRECSDDTNDVETGAIRTPDNGEMCDVEVVGPVENVYFMKETDQINHSEI